MEPAGLEPAGFLIPSDKPAPILPKRREPPAASAVRPLLTDHPEIAMTDNRTERIRQRAHEIWEREGRPEGRAQEHWYKAVQDVEAEGSEASRGPARPGPLVGDDSAPPAEPDQR
jgi:hypothetical protein